MGTDLLVKSDVERFFEFTLKVCSLEQYPSDSRRVVRIGPQIAISFFVGRKKRSGPAKIDDDIALRFGAVRARSECQRSAPRQDCLGKAIDGDGKPAQRALGLT